MPESNLHKLSALGQSVWIDYLSRQMLQSGKLAQLMEQDAVVGVTSNPTIFQKAISEGDAYDEQLKKVLESGEDDPKEIFLQLSSHDISDACDLLRPVWDEGHGLDGYVSWEVDPTLAYDREGTFDEAMRLPRGEVLIIATGGADSAAYDLHPKAASAPMKLMTMYNSKAVE